VDFVQRGHRDGLQHLEHLQPALQASDGIGMRHWASLHDFAAGFHVPEGIVPAAGINRRFALRGSCRGNISCTVQLQEAIVRNRPASSVCRFTLSFLTAAAVLPDAQAEPYPRGPIRIIVPSAAGTPPDIVTRIIANELGQSEGWQTVIENKPGAIQTIGIAEALRAPADGHTLVAIAQSSAVAPALLPGIGFRLDIDLAPIIKLTSSHHVLVVHPSVAANSVPELVALLKSQPDKFTFSSGGFGTPAHLAGSSSWRLVCASLMFPIGRSRRPLPT
jgi:hypothetical protein